MTSRKCVQVVSHRVEFSIEGAVSLMGIVTEILLQIKHSKVMSLVCKMHYIFLRCSLDILKSHCLNRLLFALKVILKDF